ncbi:hypothetical protein SFC43_25130 [Bacteroides sp. CR5/BHMF/2]|nr:hypothetical protein [Bacteroides sp. CR5/BHMF/2]
MTVFTNYYSYHEKTIHLLRISLIRLLTYSGKHIWFRMVCKSDANGNGTSWENATSIQNACKSAADGDIIYIASGNYVLPQGINITKAISLIGGFAGNENSLKNPDAQKNKAVFTGKDNRAFLSTTSQNQTRQSS